MSATAKPTVDAITALVADRYFVSVAELLGRDQTDRMSGPRKIALFLANRHAGASTRELARRFGRHQQTVWRAINLTKLRCQKPAFQQEITRLEAALQARAKSAGESTKTEETTDV